MNEAEDKAAAKMKIIAKIRPSEIGLFDLYPTLWYNKVTISHLTRLFSILREDPELWKIWAMGEWKDATSKEDHQASRCKTSAIGSERNQRITTRLAATLRRSVATLDRRLEECKPTELHESCE